MFGQLLPNKNKNATVHYSVAHWFGNPRIGQLNKASFAKRPLREADVSVSPVRSATVTRTCEPLWLVRPTGKKKRLTGHLSPRRWMETQWLLALLGRGEMLHVILTKQSLANWALAWYVVSSPENGKKWIAEFMATVCVTSRRRRLLLIQEFFSANRLEAGF
jgi:hypothetical protein